MKRLNEGQIIELYCAEHFPYKVQLNFVIGKQNNIIQAVQWCEENIATNFVMELGLFRFKTRDDAVQFKLIWGGDGNC